MRSPVVNNGATCPSCRLNTKGREQPQNIDSYKVYVPPGPGISCLGPDVSLKSCIQDRKKGKKKPLYMDTMMLPVVLMQKCIHLILHSELDVLLSCCILNILQSV